MTDGVTLDSADKEISASVQEAIRLQLDNGTTMNFNGRQFAGGSWFDEEDGVLTRQSLYVTSENEHVYSIITGKGNQRSRRAYRVSLDGETCTINNGRQEMTIELDMLMLAVRALAGLEGDAASVDAVEETLRAANS